MPRRTLTNEHDAYLRSIALGRSVKSCTTLLNDKFKTSFTEEQVRSYKSNHQIRSGIKPSEFIDRSKQRIMTGEQEQWILEHFAGIGNVELTAMFNEKWKTCLKVSQIKSHKKNRKLSSGLTGHYPKGHVPFSKGKKMSHEQYAITKRNMFKPGLIPYNTDAIGTEKVLNDRYIWVKINDIPKAKKSVNWRQKHKIIWEQHHGKIPKGGRIIFADGDNRNFNIDNLILVQEEELLYLNRNHMIYGKADLTKSAVMIAQLDIKANNIKRNKNQNDEKETLSYAN